MLNFNSVMIGANDPKVMSDFYQPIFEVEPGWSDPENGWYGYKIKTASVMIGPHSEVSGNNSEPGRFILCFEAQDPQAEYDRIKELGAKVVRELETEGDGDMQAQIATFADPEGNYFQIMSTWEE